MSRVIYWSSVFLATIFLVLPLALVLPLPFNDSSFLSYPMEGFTLRWFAQAWENQAWTNALGNSFRVAIGATIAGLLIGGLAATGVMLMPRVMQLVLTALFISPMVVPTIVIGVAFAYSYGRMGLAGSYLGMVTAHAILATPLVFLSVMTSLRGLDPQLDLAAASLGASRLHRFFHVSLPMAAPGFMAGALFAFTTSFDEVVVTLFIASPASTTLPVALFAELRDRLQPTIVVVALFLTLMSFLFLMLMDWLQKRSRPQSS